MYQAWPEVEAEVVVAVAALVAVASHTAAPTVEEVFVVEAVDMRLTSALQSWIRCRSHRCGSSWRGGHRGIYAGIHMLEWHIHDSDITSLSAVHGRGFGVEGV